MGRGSRRNPGQDAKTAARCIPHARGAVIRDNLFLPVIEQSHRRQAGMGAGEYVHSGPGENIGAPVMLSRIIQRGGVKAPARQRFGIAVDDADLTFPTR